MSDAFDKFLKQRLKEIKLDEAVFGDYIRGILDDDQDQDETVEALTDILSGVLMEARVGPFIQEIITKWNESHAAVEQPAEKPPELEVEDRLVKLLESQKLATNTVREYTEEEKKIREQILSQYSQTEVEEAEEEDDDAPRGGGGGGGELVKNTNASDVQQRVKERRENAKLESQMKKQKDKEDREKQKQQREEKKEKRKTVKGERRR